jgi:hypothetical protein
MLMLRIIVATLLVVGRQKPLNNQQIKAREKKGFGMRAQCFSCLDRLVDSVSSMSDCTFISRDKKGCIIEKVIEDFRSMQDVVFSSDLYVFSTKLFLVRRRREMWAAMESKERKFTWMKLMFERKSNLKP